MRVTFGAVVRKNKSGTYGHIWCYFNQAGFYARRGSDMSKRAEKSLAFLRGSVLRTSPTHHPPAFDPTDRQALASLVTAIAQVAPGPRLPIQGLAVDPHTTGKHRRVFAQRPTLIPQQFRRGGLS
jgi:hypothetical protein